MYEEILKQIFSGPDAMQNIAISSTLIVIIILIIAIVTRRIYMYETMKNEFITIVAHKFRTPLTQIRWSAETLLSSETDPYKKQSLNDIKSSNARLIGLTNTLLEITDRGNHSSAAYNFGKYSIVELVKSVGEQWKDLFHEKNIFFAVQCPDEDIITRLDHDRMEFVIQVLLENARNYTSPGKNVDVKIAKKFRKVVITITDSGTGIDKKDLPHIFTKFFRTNNAAAMDTEGFGVSLYLSKSIVNRHGGSIAVYSPGLDQGTQFTITLPIRK